MQGFEIECGELPFIEVVGKFTSSIKALEYAKSNSIEFALLDIDMPFMDGLKLYDELKTINPKMIIVFVTAHPSYAVEAIRKKADYIVFKPYERAEILDIIQRVKLLQGRLEKRVVCHTFGRFDLFIDGQPVLFTSAKAKEILAFCIYRQGAMVTAGEIIDKLWSDYRGSVGDCSVFRFSVKKLTDTLKQYNAENLFGRKKGICFVNKEMIRCDYYDLLSNDAGAKAQFCGEFMNEYSWAEGAIYELMLKADKL